MNDTIRKRNPYFWEHFCAQAKGMFRTRKEAHTCKYIAESDPNNNMDYRVRPRCTPGVGVTPESCHYQLISRPKPPPLQPCSLSTKFRDKTPREISHLWRCTSAWEKQTGQPHTMLSICEYDRNAKNTSMETCYSRIIPVDKIEETVKTEQSP